MGNRLGEIILIQHPEITLEVYSNAALAIGHIIATEDGSAIGIVHTVVDVCIDEGKSTQALGQSDFTDAELQKQYPHLKNSTRRLAKVWLYEDVVNITINQGVYSIEANTISTQERKYWHCLNKASLSILKKHLEWLESSTSQFSVETFIKQLSVTNKALAWELFMERFS